MAGSGRSAEAKAGLVMAPLTLVMGAAVVWLLLAARSDPLTALGFRAPLAGTLAAWIAGLALAALYVGWCLRIPPVRFWLLRPRPLKALALAFAAAAAIVEEVAFRRMLMDALEGAGAGPAAQVAASALAFGALHLLWGGLRGSRRTALASAGATAVLGLGLALVYLLGGRNLAPCIVSHFIVSALIEPGLLIAAFGGRSAPGSR